jgi:hypothetical protein
MERFIYELLDVQGVPFYVGKTNNPEYRLMVHKKRFGKDITMNILERVSAEDNWRVRERFWIESHIARGYPMLNKFVGATGPDSMDEETKRKISASEKGRPKPTGSGWQRGHKHTEDSKRKMSESLHGRVAWNKGLPMVGDNPMLGKHHSDETRAKMRGSSPWTPERRAAQAARARTQGLLRGGIQKSL